MMNQLRMSGAVRLCINYNLLAPYGNIGRLRTLLVGRSQDPGHRHFERMDKIDAVEVESCMAETGKSRQKS